MNRKEIVKDNGSNKGEMNFLYKNQLVNRYEGKLSKDELWNNLLDYFDKHNIYYDYYSSIAETGYENKPLLCLNWNEVPDSLMEWVEKTFDIECHWEDEWTFCAECGKAIRISPDSYSWEPSFIDLGGDYICKECIEVSEAIDFYKNTIKKALPEWILSDVEKEGFHCVEDICQIYESGFHSYQTDTPEKALEQCYEIFGKDDFLNKFDYLFVITNRSQFSIGFILLIRGKTE
jgi:hypothetical protein